MDRIAFNEMCKVQFKLQVIERQIEDLSNKLNEDLSASDLNIHVWDATDEYTEAIAELDDESFKKVIVVILAFLKDEKQRLDTKIDEGLEK